MFYVKPAHIGFFTIICVFNACIAKCVSHRRQCLVLIRNDRNCPIGVLRLDCADSAGSLLAEDLGVFSVVFRRMPNLNAAAIIVRRFHLVAGSRRGEFDLGTLPDSLAGRLREESV